MCFDQKSSGGFAALGLFLSIFVYKRTGNTALAGGIFFFFTMEFLQFVQYFFIDDCDSRVNQVLTLVGFLHICLQPYFTHVLNTSLTKSERVLGQFRAVKKLALLGGALLFARYFFADWQMSPPTEACPSHEWLRGERLCTYSGRFHLAWSVPMYDPTYYSPGSAIHSFLMFAPFFIFNKPMMWVQGAFLFLTGPALAAYVTPNLQEQASIWCFFSISQICVMLWLIRSNLKGEGKGAAAKGGKKGGKAN
jgi:hypothetical protein